MEQKPSSAFVTTKKGTCYLTVKSNRRNYPIMRIYAYTIDAKDKRDMRRLHPDVVFDWKKISGDGNAGALLDAILRYDRTAEKPIEEPKPKRKLELVKK